MKGRSATDQPQYPSVAGIAVFAGVRVFHPAGNPLLTSWYACSPMPSCLRLLVHLARAAASRTFWTAGNKRPMRIAMIAITTSNSISVNADRRCLGEDIAWSPERVIRTFGASSVDDDGKGAGEEVNLTYCSPRPDSVKHEHAAPHLRGAIRRRAAGSPPGGSGRPVFGSPKTPAGYTRPLPAMRPRLCRLRPATAVPTLPRGE